MNNDTGRLEIGTEMNGLSLLSKAKGLGFLV